jgi:glycogen debranching enzyme GlgX
MITNSLEEGSPFPFGATILDNGVNFAIFSEHAQRIEICVFRNDVETRHDLHGPHGGIFHAFMHGVGAGLIYGYRAYGPYCPPEGHRFNPSKLLLDPYAQAIVGKHQWSVAHDGENAADNAAIALKAMVIRKPAEAPRTSRMPDNLVCVYELHVKGFSKLLVDMPEEIRGTYAALAHPSSIAHLKQLGVTTLSLLPVQYRLDEPALVERGMTNYWGYNTLGFFCVEPRLSATPDDCVAAHAEFRAAVKALHSHGFEVLLDVVYNHTPEGDERGATLSFRGLDNANWYRLLADDQSRNENWTGCGNTLNVNHSRMMQFVLDSLRYWVETTGVDGFRFDLAPILGRTANDFDQGAAFFAAVRQDPVLSTVRLVAEPWDIGPNGYQVGNFPPYWCEWNDKFRDAVRRYWLDSTTTRGELAKRFTASSDLFNHSQRAPSASVNFITAHDGFTLTDIVSYSAKHNDANGENNRDGRSDEPCFNFGIEGVSDDLHIVATRNKVRRAMMATLLLSQGTPMICAGDEIGNTQYGNNNPYCIDNETTWLKWDRADVQFLDFTSKILSLRQREPLLRHRRWLTAENGAANAFVSWLSPHGDPMQPHEWQSKTEHAFACVIAQNSAQAQCLYIAFNPHTDAQRFSLPQGKWHALLDSSLELDVSLPAENTLTAPSRAILVLAARIPE